MVPPRLVYLWDHCTNSSFSWVLFPQGGGGATENVPILKDALGENNIPILKGSSA